jgi:hypothetical protein
MSTPVTRGELQEELQQFKAEIAQLATKSEIANFATKVDLEIWGGALLARMDGIEQRLLPSSHDTPGRSTSRWRR